MSNFWPKMIDFRSKQKLFDFKNDTLITKNNQYLNFVTKMLLFVKKWCFWSKKSKSPKKLTSRKRSGSNYDHVFIWCQKAFFIENGHFWSKTRYFERNFLVFFA